MVSTRYLRVVSVLFCLVVYCAIQPPLCLLILYMVDHILSLFLFCIMKSSLVATHYVCKNPVGLACEVFLRKSFAFVPGRRSTEECKTEIESWVHFS